jgi:hypothetical protein
MLDRVWLSLVVEGHGEVRAAPTLVKRVAANSFPDVQMIFAHPIRKRRNQIVKPDELERAGRLAVSTLRGPGAVLVLIDADDDCPAALGPQLLARAESAAGTIPIEIVVAKSEYESWFLAAAESLRGLCGLSDDLTSPPDPEGLRGAKGWLKRHMPANRTYSETTDQKTLSAAMDLEAASTTSSFDKLTRSVERLLQTVSADQ